MYADFAGAKICLCPNSAVGSVCEPLIGSSPGSDLVRLDRGVLPKLFFSFNAV